MDGMGNQKRVVYPTSLKLKYFFQIQLLRGHRILKEIGIPVWISCLLVIALFFLLSFLIIGRNAYGTWAYSVIPFFIAKGSFPKDFVALHFSKRHLSILKAINATLMALPFLFFLAWRGNYYEIMGMIVCIPAFSVMSQPSMKFYFSMPTPFQPSAFEFIRGFRKTWLFFILTYLLIAIGVSVDNFNLVAVVMVMQYFIILGFYSDVEPEWFVWNSSLTPRAFISHKITMLLRNALLIVSPCLLVFFFFPERWMVLIGIVVIGISLSMVSVLVKYSRFPQRDEIITLIMVGCSILFPPLILFLVPYLASKAVQNLKRYK